MTRTTRIMIGTAAAGALAFAFLINPDINATSAITLLWLDQY